MVPHMEDCFEPQQKIKQYKIIIPAGYLPAIMHTIHFNIISYEIPYSTDASIFS